MFVLYLTFVNTSTILDFYLDFLIYLILFVKFRLQFLTAERENVFRFLEWYSYHGIMQSLGLPIIIVFTLGDHNYDRTSL